jgi:O-antigen/teichoic acid export membrane protein
LLDIWVGESFADESTLVLQLLAVGLVINSLAQVAVSLIQAVGRPDLTAKRHLLELPVYVALMLLAIPAGGIEAAAGVWLLWAGVDAGILIALLYRLVPGSIETGDLWRLFGSAATLLALALAAGQAPNAVSGLILGITTLGLSLLVATAMVLDSRERRFLRRLVGRLRRSSAPA